VVGSRPAAQARYASISAGGEVTEEVLPVRYLGEPVTVPAALAA
jgi:hypothetical protein